MYYGELSKQMKSLEKKMGAVTLVLSGRMTEDGLLDVAA